MGRRSIAAGVTVSALLLASLSASAASAGTSTVSGRPGDNPTQTLGVATLYNTSAPLGLTAAPASSSSSAKTDANAHLFARDPKMAASAAPPKTPSRGGIPGRSSHALVPGLNGL